MSYTTLIYHTFLSVESIRLGQLVWNVNESQSDYLDSDSDFHSKSVIITPHLHYKEVQQSMTDKSLIAMLTHFMLTSCVRWNKAYTQVTTDWVTTYQLKNSGSWFKSVIKTKIAWEWIKKFIDQRDDIYVIVEYHTMLNAQVIEGTADTLKSSEQLELLITKVALTATDVMMPLSNIADLEVAANNIKKQGIQRQFVADDEQICAVQYQRVHFK